MAKVAGISKYHFHRIFKAITNETLNNYIKRRKMERACRQIITDKNKSLTDVAFDTGYNSSANFSRDFTNFYNISPSKTRQLEQIPVNREVNYKADLDIAFTGIKRIPEMNVRYIRVSSGYNPVKIQPAFKKLLDYALSNNLFYSPEQFIGIGYDDPDFTPPSKCRYDACLLLPGLQDVTHDIPFNMKTIKSADYAVFLFEGRSEEMFPAWDYIFKEWLINSNYIPDHRPHLEMYKPCRRYMEGYFKANLCLPVKKLQ